MDSLRPCPFCGGEAELHPTYDCDSGEVDGYFVWCGNYACECKPETGQFSTEAEAIAAWNTRYHSEFEKTVIKAWKEIKDYTERTCHEYGSVRVWQTCNVWSHELSCGHEVDTLESEPPNYCPNCGAKVIGG